MFCDKVLVVYGPRQSGKTTANVTTQDCPPFLL